MLVRRNTELTLLRRTQFLALLCFFQGAKISNHSAIIGPSDAPAFADYPFHSSSSRLSALGARRLSVMLALHDQVAPLSTGRVSY